MNKTILALVLIIGAGLLAAGALMLMPGKEEPGPVHRAEVPTTQDEPAKAPDWVKKGQDVKPEYDQPAPETAPVPQPQAPTAIVEEPKTIEVTEDNVVTFTFIESLSDFILYKFLPMGPEGRPVTLATPVTLNRYFGHDLDGFAVTGDDLQSDRRSVLDYAFNPTMVQTLYALYAKPFMVYLVETAGVDEREYTVGDDKEIRTLTPDEIKTMLTLNASRIDRSAALFRSMGTDTAAVQMTSQHHRAAKDVQKANERLQQALATGKGVNEASKRLKSAIQKKDQTRKAVIAQLKQSCPDCSDGELFYVANWAYRRVQAGGESQYDTFLAVSDILSDLAQRFRDQADKVK